MKSMVRLDSKEIVIYVICKTAKPRYNESGGRREFAAKKHVTGYGEVYSF